MWFDGQKKSRTFSEILSFLKESLDFSPLFIIGTDSQPHKEGTQFVTAIAILSCSKDYDSKYFYFKHEPKVIEGLYNRMFEEAQMSINLVEQIRSETSGGEVEIHLDISPSDSQNRTSQYSNSLTSLVKAYGISSVKVKPNSWCASFIADAHSK